jgi:hypothetical protein
MRTSSSGVGRPLPVPVTVIWLESSSVGSFGLNGWTGYVRATWVVLGSVDLVQRDSRIPGEQCKSTPLHIRSFGRLTSHVSSANQENASANNESSASIRIQRLTYSPGASELGIVNVHL